MLALWDTTGSEVVKKLASERRTGGVASGLALTVVVVAEPGRVREVEAAATVAAAEHPCRFLIVSRGPVAGPDAATAQAKDRLDAEIVVGGRLGPCEAVIMRMHGRLALHAESVVIPLLAPDVPVVTWWHGAPPERLAFDPLSVIADRRITDVAQSPDPAEALRQRAIDYAPGDTDLAWTRLTEWRSILAGAFDAGSPEVTSATVTGPTGGPAAALLWGWLSSRLDIPVALKADEVLSGVDFRLDDKSVLTLRPQHNGTARLTRSGFPDRIRPLGKRRLGDELAEELRRLDPDQAYCEALEAATSVPGLGTHPAARVHIWRDPVPA